MRSSLTRLAHALFLTGLLATSCGSYHPPLDVAPNESARVTASELHFANWSDGASDLLNPAAGELSSPYSRASQQPATFIRWPDKFWAKNYRPTFLWPSADLGAQSQIALPQWSWLEFMGQQRNGRLLVHYPGDGRIAPREAWVAALDVMVAAPPLETELPRAYPATLRSDTVRLPVPYRTQLDNSPWADANCGPTTLGMALEWVGIDVPAADLRKAVLDEQGFWGNDAGVLMDALATVGQQRGARILDLYDGDAFARWSIDDVRAHIGKGHPVVLQVLFRALPRREDSLYWGDHFIVVTGMVGNDFLYNDPVDSDGVGFDRIMTPTQLQLAMNASDRRYAYAGFAVAKN